MKRCKISKEEARKKGAYLGVDLHVRSLQTRLILNSYNWNLEVETELFKNKYIKNK